MRQSRQTTMASAQTARSLFDILEFPGSPARFLPGLTPEAPEGNAAAEIGQRTGLVRFYQELRSAGVPVTLREYLDLMQALEVDLASRRIEDFYYLSRATLVKDERNLDKFDRVFGHVFKGLEQGDELAAEIPTEWLKKLAEKYLTEEEKKQIEALGGLDKLLETLRQRLAEQKGRHHGGKKWIGTGGTSPFGAYGYNPEGIRIGQDKNRNFRAVKVWDKREFKDLDDEVELGTPNIKIALRRLRKFDRTGAPEG